MKRSKTLLVHDRLFQTIGECVDFFKNMIGQYEDGDTVSEDHYPYLYSLLSDHHDDAARKIGCGVRSFEVHVDPVWKKNLYFVIVRVDGSTEDFSYHKCISKSKDGHRHDVIKAMRHDVYEQTRRFRDNSYGNKKYVRCAITGLNTQKKDCHIDHAPPFTFLTLVRDFMAENGLRVSDIIVSAALDRSCVTPLTLADSGIRQAWQEYHAKKAILRVTLDHANLGQQKTRVDLENSCRATFQQVLEKQA